MRSPFRIWRAPLYPSQVNLHPLHKNKSADLPVSIPHPFFFFRSFPIPSSSPNEVGGPVAAAMLAPYWPACFQLIQGLLISKNLTWILHCLGKRMESEQKTGWKTRRDTS